MGKLTKRAGAVAAVTAVAVSAAGVAWAYWSATGQGRASAMAQEAQPLVATATAEGLYPGGSGALKIQIANPNPYPVLIDSVVQGAQIDVIPKGELTGCEPDDVELSNLDGYLSVNPIAVPARQSLDNAQSVSIPSAVTMRTSAPDGCQGATFTIDLLLAGMQAPVG